MIKQYKINIDVLDGEKTIEIPYEVSVLIEPIEYDCLCVSYPGYVGVDSYSLIEKITFNGNDYDEMPVDMIKNIDFHIPVVTELNLMSRSELEMLLMSEISYKIDQLNIQPPLHEKIKTHFINNTNSPCSSVW